MLDWIKWSARRTLLAFDTDKEPNQKVEDALNAIEGALASRNARVERLRLPQSKGGGKVGLDDYIVANGAKALKELAAATCTNAFDYRKHMTTIQALLDDPPEGPGSAEGLLRRCDLAGAAAGWGAGGQGGRPGSGDHAQPGRRGRRGDQVARPA